MSAAADQGPAGHMDTATLRNRWPEVLAAVQQAKKVAWIQLSDATVESLTDGVLTLAFARPGMAKGFMGGYDKDLANVLTSMFGITPHITTTMGGSGPAQRVADEAAAIPPPAPSPEDPEHPRGQASQRPGSKPGPAGRRADDRASRAATPGDRRSTELAADEPDPGDAPAAETLTGADLIQRELGGKIIEELGGP
jgi:DNA polymerase III subunit gamma/tau